MQPHLSTLTAPAAAALLLAALAATAADPAPKPSSNEWFLAVGHGGHRMLSRDGKTWEKHASWGEPKHDQNDLNVAANFKGAFYAGGGYFSGRLAATRDGKEWSDGVLPASSPIFGLEVLDDVLYAIDLRGAVFKTADGEKWELVARAEMPSKTHWIRGTAQGNGLIVGSGDYGPAIVFTPKTGKITVTQMAGQTDKNATWQRVAFGNGVFVVGGQTGLLAVTKDGKTWENNAVNADRGDVQCVEFTGTEFLATTTKNTLRSTDGKTWTESKAPPARQVRRIGEYLYTSTYAPSKLARSADGGKTWEALPNESGWHFKAFARGPLSGGAPPAVPQPPKK
jgi:photosystem II stability/assembly factor-like uncharacterized protein